MNSTLTVTTKVHFGTAKEGALKMRMGPAPDAPVPAGRVPKLARLMALAIRLDNLLRAGDVADYFLASAQSILFSIEDRPIVRQLKDVGYFDRVVGYLAHAINWSFLLALFTAVGMLLDWSKATKEQPAYLTPLFSIWCGLLVTALLSYYRIIRIFSKLLRAKPGS